MVPAEPRTLEIARWAAALTVADIPERVLERARLQRANTVAAARAGASAAGVTRLRQAARVWAAKGPAEVVGERYRLEPAAAVYANAAASIAHDWDDYLYAGHTGHSSVWASRAVAAATGASAGDALAAQVAANEVAGRLGAALLLGPHNGQFWASIHCAGGAIAAGRLMRLDPEQLAHALAIALYQPPFGLWPGFMGPDTKLLTAAEPAAQGVRAAGLAERSFSGPLEVIEDRRGVLAQLAFAPRPSMLDGLGDVWLTDTLAYKPRPGCAYLQSSVEALLRLQADDGFGADDVAAIDVAGGYLTAGMEALSAGPSLTAVRVNFSVALSAAVALIAGRLTHEELDEAWLAEREPEIRALAVRVRLHHDWDLTLETIRGVTDALPLAAQARDVRLSGLRAMRRRMRELGMDELAIGLADLRELAARADVKRALRGALVSTLDPRRRRGPRGLAALDTSRLRMPFPARVQVKLRSGRMLETDGRERGGAGAPLDEQRQVVCEKWSLCGGRPEALAELAEAA
jgi:2-methylcitrate dehydratase PrpD